MVLLQLTLLGNDLVHHLSEYLIKGSSGFAQEGWYIETPKDANGSVLFSVIYATLENGDISVKTYKKKKEVNYV